MDLVEIFWMAFCFILFLNGLVVVWTVQNSKNKDEEDDDEV